MKKTIFKSFIDVNIYCSKIFESLFWFKKGDRVLLNSFFEEIERTSTVADVGGGKKPAKNLINRTHLSCAKYDGYDIDLKELAQAKHDYSQIFVMDLTSSDILTTETYDYVICLNTLEHVKDASLAVKNLSSMLNDGASLYIKLPCRYALFAQLNLILPNELKKTVMHAVFPSKIGDGFPVYYDKSTPREMLKVCSGNGLEVVDIAYKKWSSYFSFFFPLYVLWRLYAMIQDVFISDYCESFEIILKKKPC